MVVVVTRLLANDGGMAEGHGPPEAGQISKAWIRGRMQKSERRKESVAGTVQSEMRSVLARFTVGGSSILPILER